MVKHGDSLLTNYFQGVIHMVGWYADIFYKNGMADVMHSNCLYFAFPVIRFKENYRYFFASFNFILIKFADHLKLPLLMALIEPQLTFVGIFLTNVLWDYFFVARKYLNTESPRIMRFQFCVVHTSIWKFKNGFSIGMYYLPWLHFEKIYTEI